jgi:hypothetical protein
MMREVSWHWVGTRYYGVGFEWDVVLLNLKEMLSCWFERKADLSDLNKMSSWRI